MKTLSKMDSEIKKCVDLLLDGKVILYPTDTVWGIGCDATNVEAINRIYKIKERQERKSLKLLVFLLVCNDGFHLLFDSEL